MPGRTATEMDTFIAWVIVICFVALLVVGTGLGLLKLVERVTRPIRNARQGRHGRSE